MFDKILGGLIGGAAGDAIGAATEGRSTEQILEYFGHPVRDFETPPMDTFGGGNKPGQLTDDFSSAYFVAESIVKNKGIVSRKAVQDALVKWSEHAVFFDRFAGPTTRLAIKTFKGEEIIKASGVELVTRQATDGASMKIAPIGLLNAGNIEQAIVDAAEVTMVTHDNYLAISGACALAAAVSEATKRDADMYSILKAGFYGAKEGERIGRAIGRDVAGPSVISRMEIAIDIGLGTGTPWEKMIDIGERVGAGLHIAEALPSAFGLFAANDGDALESIVGAVNVGYDTDTVATMSGALSGTLHGAKAFPKHFLPILEEANGLDIEGLAQSITAIAREKQKAMGGE